jgi:hypothetical protein
MQKNCKWRCSNDYPQPVYVLPGQCDYRLPRTSDDGPPFTTLDVSKTEDKKTIIVHYVMLRRKLYLNNVGTHTCTVFPNDAA